MNLSGWGGGESVSQETSDLEGKLSLHKPGDLESESAGNFSEAHV